MTSPQIEEVRRFHRLVTQRAGALEGRFLGRDRPLGESRVLFEIGRQGAELRDLRTRLGLDPGYLSRLVQSLSSVGLVRLNAGASDDRARRAELTAAGLLEYDEVNRRSDKVAEDILLTLTESQRERLVAAMTEVNRLLKLAALVIERVDPSSEIAQWCLTQYFAELAVRFEGGFDPRRSSPLDPVELIPPRGAFLLASADQEPLACGSVKLIAPGVGWLRRMWVAPSARGLGMGRRILGALEAEAQSLGVTTLRLDTNRSLTEAIQLYRSSGYRAVERFSDERYADHFFEKQLPRVRGKTSPRRKKR